MRGFTVYMTEKEYEGISDCVAFRATVLEGADPDFAEEEQPLMTAAENFLEKCNRSRTKSNDA